ncbi:phosphotransferase family protein [Streptomyces mirabilis]|uniref:phosphotransferase family protein n=1 Tax=Streptomyces mirabilis TaxID=68239 RepID=UPI0036A27E11
MPHGKEIGDVAVTACNSRNSGYLVDVGAEAYFVKTPLSPAQSTTLRHEASVYQTLMAADGLHGFAPRLIRYEPDLPILILQGFSGTDSTDPLLISSRRSLVRIGRMLGRTLALLHSTPHNKNDVSANSPPPLCLDLPPLGLRTHLSGATTEFLRLVQHDTALTGALAQCRRAWRKTSWIHGEIKWPHFLLHRRTDRSAAYAVRLVDYESSGIGEPAWDLGCVFASYLDSWLASMPPPTCEPVAVMVSRSALSPRDVHEAVTALWRAYTRLRGLTVSERDELLAAALHYVVASLLWSVFESSVSLDTLTETALLRLQVAHNLAQRPREGARYLLGLPPS